MLVRKWRRRLQGDCPVVWDAISSPKTQLFPTLSLTSPLPPSLNRKSLVKLMLAVITGVYFARRRVLAMGNSTRLSLSHFLSTQIDAELHRVNKASKAKAKAAARAERALALAPANAAIAYTDGSAIPNPGPAGAGAFISLPDGSSRYLWEALGDASNNHGEVWAIGMTASFLGSINFRGPLVLASDSKFALGVLTRGHTPRRLIPLCRSASESLAALGQEIIPIWTPGHCGILGNEIADRLADKGARRSKALGLPTAAPPARGFRFRETAIRPRVI